MKAKQNTPAPSHFADLMAQAQTPPPVTDPRSMTVGLRKIGDKMLFVCELRTHTKPPSAYPCGSLESALRLTGNFFKGLTRSTDRNPHEYDRPPRSAEQVAA